jgi:hypothetical protein
MVSWADARARRHGSECHGPHWSTGCASWVFLRTNSADCGGTDRELWPPHPNAMPMMNNSRPPEVLRCLAKLSRHVTVAAARGWLRAVDLRRPRKSRRSAGGCRIRLSLSKQVGKWYPSGQSIFRRYLCSPDRYGKWCDTRVKSLCFGCD